MSATQSYVHIKPVVVNYSKKKISSSIINAPSIRNIKVSNNNNLSTRLKIPLLKFPGIIGHSTSRINRRHNDDTYSVNILKGINGKNRPVLNLSVFDGHGSDGAKVSKLLSDNLHRELVDNNNHNLINKENFFNLLHDYSKNIGGKYWQRLYKERIKFYDKFIKNCNTKQEQVLFDTEKQGTRMLFDNFGNLIDKNSLLDEYQRLQFYYTFLKFDLEKCCQVNTTDMSIQSNPFNGGSTASSIFVSPFNGGLTDSSFFVEPTGLLKLVVTQVGDSRVLICDSNGIAHNLSNPHTAKSIRESHRLEKDQDTNKDRRNKTDYMDLDAFGETRFLNNYANTRSFGDLSAKNHGLSAEPDIFSYLVGNTKNLPYSERSKLQFGGDECFITLITDGVSDLMSDQEIVDLITTTVNRQGLRKATPQFVAEEVIKFISTIAGRDADNATCLVLRLPNWGNWPTTDRTGQMREDKLLNNFH